MEANSGALVAVDPALLSVRDEVLVHMEQVQFAIPDLNLLFSYTPNAPHGGQAYRILVAEFGIEAMASNFWRHAKELATIEEELLPVISNIASVALAAGAKRAGGVVIATEESSNVAAVRLAISQVAGFVKVVEATGDEPLDNIVAHFEECEKDFEGSRLAEWLLTGDFSMVSKRVEMEVGESLAWCRENLQPYYEAPFLQVAKAVYSPASAPEDVTTEWGNSWDALSSDGQRIAEALYDLHCSTNRKVFSQTEIKAAAAKNGVGASVVEKNSTAVQEAGFMASEKRKFYMPMDARKWMQVMLETRSGENETRMK
jgi:hypothetical protein